MAAEEPPLELRIGFVLEESADRRGGRREAGSELGRHSDNRKTKGKMKNVSQGYCILLRSQLDFNPTRRHFTKFFRCRELQRFLSHADATRHFPGVGNPYRAGDSRRRAGQTIRRSRTRRQALLSILVTWRSDPRLLTRRLWRRRGDSRSADRGRHSARRGP